MDLIDFHTLCDVAYKKERVLGRRLAAASGLSEHEALHRTLEQVAAPLPLGNLIAARQSARLSDLARRAARRQEQLAALAAKRAHAMPDAAAWLAWFDGSTHPNPGRMGLGGVLRGPAGQVVEISCVAGQGDSNQAEYLALIALLEAALRVGPTQLVIHGDSRVVIDDLTGAQAGGVASLAPHRLRAQQLLAQFADVALRWVPRERNAAADALSQRAIRHPPTS